MLVVVVVLRLRTAMAILRIMATTKLSNDMNHHDNAGDSSDRYS